MEMFATLLGPGVGAKQRQGMREQRRLEFSLFLSIAESAHITLCVLGRGERNFQVHASMTDGPHT